jgi:lipopolysaccharide biosynthesis glycosyltransferase
MKHIFIGHDPRESLASIVCKYSIISNLSVNEEDISIQFINKKELQHQNVYYRKAFISEKGQYFDTIDSKPFSTEFAFSRFLTPELCRMQHKDGWALFVDSDFVFLENINKLFDLADDKYSVMCVKFNWVPPEDERYKMDNVIQTRYTKKLWSSLMLFNLNHPDVKKLDHKAVNLNTGSYLHKFKWTNNNNIGSLPVEWNFVPSVTTKAVQPKAIHYTKGGPWFEEYKDCDYSAVWIDYLNSIPKNFILNHLME